ncbi:hypothetical protein FKP32DRAFT_320242 [Trametes sanguinea]|nr:hypothetical protein FKP32DRAFT_320242 [Trametes sanguinea]
MREITYLPLSQRVIPDGRGNTRCRPGEEVVCHMTGGRLPDMSSPMDERCRKYIKHMYIEILDVTAC